MNALELVKQQAEDDGLWFRAQTAPEAYLQQELRKLHAAVEDLRENQFRLFPTDDLVELLSDSTMRASIIAELNSRK